jgi:phytoene synthase
VRDEAEHRSDGGAVGVGATRRRGAGGADVDRAYAEVQRLTRARARNFAYGIMVLPKAKRRAIAAIYAFARAVDDIADGDAPADEKRAGLEDLHRRLDGPPGDEAIWTALADARGRFPIPSQSLHDLVDGGLIDLDRQRYDTFDELRDYCAHVAGAVGVACIGVYGADQPQRAEALGIALQLINIIRDVREDWELGRVYLPQDELASCGVTEEDIGAARLTPAWQALMAYQAARARSYLEEGMKLRDYLDVRSSACARTYLQDGRLLLDHLDHRSAACVGTFADLYRATLERIEASGFAVFDGAPRLSPLTKLRIVGSSFL